MASDTQLFSREDYEIALRQRKQILIHYDISTKTMTLPQHIATMLGMDKVMLNVPDSLLDRGLVVDNAEAFRNFFAALCAGSPQEKVLVALMFEKSPPLSYWVEGCGTTVFNRQGQPQYAVITVTDISSHRETAYFYQKWEHTIQAQITESIRYYDYNLTTDRVIMSSDAIKIEHPEKYPQTFSGRVAFAVKYLVHPDDREKYLHNFTREALIEQFHRHVRESKIIHRRRQMDGHYIWVQRITQLFADPYNKNIHCAIMVKKLDEGLVRLQEALHADTQDLLSNAIPGGIIVSYNRPGYPVHYINDHMLNYLGYTYDEFMADTGGYSTNIIHPEDSPEAMRHAMEAIAQKREFEIRYRVMKKDGSVGWVITHGRESTDKDGQDILISVLIDVTEIIRLQEALQLSAQEAADATRLKSLFLAKMSHEIRTPMNGILGFAELAQDQPELSASVRDYLEKIKISAAGLLSIINDILDISKIEAGKMELERIPFPLHDVLTHCENISRMRAEEKGIALYFYTEPFVWQTLWGDPTKLNQILLNLLSNAIRFTEKGAVKLAVIPESSRENTVTLRFTVKDSGIGMTAEELERVVAPFSQADNSTTRKYGGTGLGLTITRDIIQLMGGELKAESTPGIGSCFSFSLTFDTMEAVEATGTVKSFEAVEAVGTGESSAPVIRKPRFSGTVLVCEDNSINQQVIAAHLERVGLTPVIAANGQIGVDLVMEQLMLGKSFDLILMDIHMPVMDGIEAAQKMISFHIDTPIIALTANAMKQDRESYLSLGMRDYLSKPFYGQELWACLLKYLTPLTGGTDSVNE